MFSPFKVWQSHGRLGGLDNVEYGITILLVHAGLVSSSLPLDGLCSENSSFAEDHFVIFELLLLFSQILLAFPKGKGFSLNALERNQKDFVKTKRSEQGTRETEIKKVQRRREMKATRNWKSIQQGTNNCH